MWIVQEVVLAAGRYYPVRKTVDRLRYIIVLGNPGEFDIPGVIATNRIGQKAWLDIFDGVGRLRERPSRGISRPVYGSPEVPKLKLPNENQHRDLNNFNTQAMQ